MTGKQRRFCHEYIKDFDEKASAIRAGYSPNGAQACGNTNVKQKEIQEYIANMMDDITDSNIATAKEVMKYLTSVMRGESISYEVVIEGIGNGFSRAREFEKRPCEKERLKAGELLGKRYALFTDKINLEVEPVTIVNDLVE